ncbi:MAG: hypothetical protein GY729_02280, partial [Desulfobacteraceae bacterium]|nr:hypothetical protein [Desulfobacteraceae bacterium]
MDRNSLKEKLKQALAAHDNRNKENKREQRSPFWAIAAIGLLIVIMHYSTTLFNPKQPSGPWAKITTPAIGSTTGQRIKVVGESGNLQPGQFLWLAVDKPHKGLCWPKPPHLRANMKFQTTIDERGPKEAYILSLYVLNQKLHMQWRQWVREKK